MLNLGIGCWTEESVLVAVWMFEM